MTADPAPPPTGFGFETIQFASKFGASRPDPFRLIDAAAAAGYDWISFDRHTLLEQAAAPGGLAALARACTAANMPCRSVQSLRLLPSLEASDTNRSGADADHLIAQVEALSPDVVPVMPLYEPGSRGIAAATRTMQRLLEVQPDLRFGLEFGPVFPILDVNAARMLVERIGHPALGLLVDSWHVFIGSTGLRGVNGLTAGDIALIQLNDHGPLAGVPIEQAKNQRLMPGAGSFELQKFADSVGRLGYRGLVSVEVISAESRGLGPERFARDSLAAARRLDFSAMSPRKS